jgi:pimeloyl-ACP methyl ester carboxylesterase
MFRFLKYLINSLRPIKSLNVSFDSGGKRKPTIVLLHGIAATSKTWDVLIKELDTKLYRVIALDLLGFGMSPKPINCSYTVDDHAMYIRKTLKRLKVKKPYKLVGHSMGSIISAHIGYLFPSDIDELILLSPPLYISDPKLNVIARTRTDLYMNAYDFILKNKDFTINNSQFLRKLLRIEDGSDVNQDNWNSFKLSLQNTIIKQKAFDEIKGGYKPTHIIFGTMDEFLVQESINKLSGNDHIRITKLIGVNHLLGKRFAKTVAKQIIS